MAAGASLDIVTIRVFPFSRIAVCRSKQHKYLRTLIHLYAAQAHRLRCCAKECLHRGLQPAPYPERRTCKRGTCVKLGPLIRKTAEADEGRPKTIHRGVEPSAGH